MEVASETRRRPQREISDVKQDPPARRDSGTQATNKRPRISESDWYRTNEELIMKADAIISAQLANRTIIGEYTDLSVCHDILGVMRGSLNCEVGAQSTSVLVLGEPGSGKTHAVEWCLERLQQEQPADAKPITVLRAHGGAYSSDVECIRHLASQVVDQDIDAPSGNASFEQGMEWIRGVLKDTFRLANTLVIVLDKFEHFASRARQTLLYNLFDVAQEVGVRLCIVGTSQKMDVIKYLEKRIKSRFSMRHLHTSVPTDVEGLVRILMAKLTIPKESGLEARFIKEFQKALEIALLSKKSEWQDSVDLGRPPSWFLWQCLPVTRLLLDASPNDRSAKRRPVVSSLNYLPSEESEESKALLVESLSETQHIALLALYRMQCRQAACMLSYVLHEIQLLHESGGFVSLFNEGRYTSAFNRLLEMKLIEMYGSNDGKRYAPCTSLVDHIYTQLVKELEYGLGKSGSSALPPGFRSNPLRKLPLPVQQWALRASRA